MPLCPLFILFYYFHLNFIYNEKNGLKKQVSVHVDIIHLIGSVFSQDVNAILFGNIHIYIVGEDFLLISSFICIFCPLLSRWKSNSVNYLSTNTIFYLPNLEMDC